jgi:hypothetical protein
VSSSISSSASSLRSSRSGASESSDGPPLVETYEDPIDVEGIPEKTSTAVTYRATVRLATGEETFADTGHLVDRGGGWRWILAPEDVRAYEDDACPAESAE